MVKIGDTVQITFGKRRGEIGKIVARGKTASRWMVRCKDARVEYPEVKFRSTTSSRAKKKTTRVKRPCGTCGKAVYKNEEIFVMEKYYHENCFKCTSCRKRLTLITYKEYREEPFCETCYGRTDNAAVGFGPGRVGNYEKHRTHDVSPPGIPKTSPPKRKNVTRAAARRSIERRKKKVTAKPPSWVTSSATARKKKKKTTTSKPRSAVRQLKRTPRNAPPPKMVNMYEKNSAKMPKSRVKKSQPTISGNTKWKCVHPKGVSYRQRYLDNNSKTRYPKGPTPGQIVTAVEFRNGWIRVAHTGTEMYWLPVEIKGVGVCFKQVSGGGGGFSSWFGGGGRDESSSDEEVESSSEEEAETPPPRAPQRRVPARNNNVKKKKKKKKKKDTSTSSSSMLGNIFSAFGFTSDEQKGNGAEWECIYEDGVSWRRRRGDNSSKVTSIRGPEYGDVIKVSVYRDGWIKSQSKGFWLPVSISGIGTLFKLVKKSDGKKKSKPSSWDEEEYGA